LFTAGGHFQLDDGECPDDEQFVRSTAAGISKDAPDSYWSTIGIYAQDEWDVSTRFRATMALRWDGFNFETRLDSFYTPPGDIDPAIDEIEERENTLTGGFGLLYRWSESLNLFGNLSRGFRQYAPVFGIKQHGYGIQVPSGLLNPATSLNYELGAKLRSARLRGSAAVYYSQLRDFPVVVRTTYEGQDWYDWNGSGTRDVDEDTYVTVNSAEAYVCGVELDGRFEVGSGWSASAGFAYSYGRDETRDEPLRHTIPAWGTVKLSWHEPTQKRLWVELSSEAAAAFDRIPSDRIYRDPGYRTDPQDMESPLIGPEGRVPGWIVFNLRGEYALSETLTLNLAAENITDKGYRRVHSRWDEYGFNLVLSVTVSI
jgi:outer membrane receptor protein involved in Fe transport